MGLNVIADSQSYCPDTKARGLAILLCLAVPLIVVPAYLFAVPPAGISGAREAALALVPASIALMLFAGLYLKGRGILFKVPLKVFEEGILIQTAVSIRPRLVQMREISAFEAWFDPASNVRSGCIVRTSSGGALKSVENFPDKASLEAFAERIAPALARGGLCPAPAAASETAIRRIFRRAALRARLQAGQAEPI